MSVVHDLPPIDIMEEKMAYLFFDDGGPDAEDYHNNYLFFNEKNCETLSCIIHIMCTKDTADPLVKTELQTLCQESFKGPPEITSRHGLAGWFKQISTLFKPRSPKHFLSYLSWHMKAGYEDQLCLPPIIW